jgi:SPP1 family predicted phage head-tail adaptor
MWRDVISLVTITYTESDIGDIVETRTNRQVYANKKSIRQSEFYQAQANGLRPEAMFEMRSIDYQDEQKLLHDGKEYNVIRTYSKNGEILELVCDRLVGG